MSKVLYLFDAKRSEDCTDWMGDEPNHIGLYIWPQDCESFNKMTEIDDDGEVLECHDDNLHFDSPDVADVLGPLGITHMHCEMENSFLIPNTVTTVEDIKKQCIAAGWIHKEMLD